MSSRDEMAVQQQERVAVEEVSRKRKAWRGMLEVPPRHVCPVLLPSPVLSFQNKNMCSLIIYSREFCLKFMLGCMPSLSF